MATITPYDLLHVHPMFRYVNPLSLFHVHSILVTFHLHGSPPIDIKLVL